ncbi:MAG: MarR family transcriptional regulator [Proteobacteria bacterium]|nr:MAG: MarR family transcriptional regulator [Pseudomonadota bacterium]
MTRKEISEDSAAGILDSCRRLVQIVHTASKSTEKSLGMSSAQHFVLQQLAEGNPLSIKDLAGLTHTHQSSVSVVAKKLLEKNLIFSISSNDDLRRTVLTITAKGKKVLTKWSGAQVQGRLLEAAKALPLSERENLNHLLTSLLHNLEDSASETSMFLED